MREVENMDNKKFIKTLKPDSVLLEIWEDLGPNETTSPANSWKRLYFKEQPYKNEQ